MRFTLRNLCWLIVAVALASLVARSLTGDVSAIVLGWVGLVYAFAPLLLALASSFLQVIPARKREVTGYYVLLVLGGLPALLLFFMSPVVSALFVVATCFIWLFQMSVYAHIHDKQDEQQR